MALGPTLSLDSKTRELLSRGVQALEKLAEGESKEQIQFRQYISGGEEGIKEEGQNFVVRITGCDEDRARIIMHQMVTDVSLYAGEQIETERR